MYFILSKDNPQVTENAIKHIRGLPLHKRVLVDVKEYRKNRTNAQNRLMWKWYGILSDHTGYEPEELHEMMKARVLGFESVTVPAAMNRGNEVTYQRPRSSTTLNTKEMTDFMVAIEQLAQELGCTLVYPEDYSYMMGYDNK